MATSSPPSQHSAYPQRISRSHSPVLAQAVPWLSVMLGSLVPQWLMIASAPLMPPVGLLLLVAWRQLRPGVFPVWAGLPLGLFDDLYSGQPFGSAMLAWSIAMIALEVIETRFPWRNPVLDWLVAALFIAGNLLLGLLFVDAGGGEVSAAVLAPQAVLSILLFPLVGRLVSWLDRLRLLRFKAFA